MAITVKHSKVSLIPDAGDASLVEPSDWNADHTLTGLGTMAEQDSNNVNITGGTVATTTLTTPTVSNYENFTPTTAPSYLEGRVWYDSTEKALAFYNDSSALAVHIGQDLIFKVINNTGLTLANGSPVYITGTSSGQIYPNVALAKADVAATSAVIGLTNGAIANGAIGYVTSQGTIDNVNTSTFTVGQVLYLSPYSAGQLMNTIPPTGITVQVGVVTYVDSSAGHIYVKQTTPLAVPASIITGQVAVANGGTGASTASGARTNLGLGTIATQDANAVAITGGAIDGASVGTTTASTGKFTTLEATGTSSLGTASAQYIQAVGDATYPQVKATGSGTNIPLVLQPKGTGALQAQLTDSTATGGNVRGANAVDWQTSRSTASQVASGGYATISGGTVNTASSFYAVVGGGNNNAATGFGSAVLGGNSNTASGFYASALVGSNNTAAGYYNFVGAGYGNSGTAAAAVTTQAAATNGVVSGSATVTLAASNANIKVGQYITGTGIPSNTYVAAIVTTTLTLSQNANATGTPTLSFFTPHGVVVGGGNNQATGSYSFIGGGGDAGTAANRNAASGDWSTIVGGKVNAATGNNSFIGGGNNISVSGTNGVAVGGASHVVSGSYAATVGSFANSANGQGSFVVGNRGASRGITGINVFSGWTVVDSTVGSGQSSLLILGRATTDATPAVLTSDSSTSASTTNQVILPNNSAYYFKGSVIAGVTGAGNSKAWSFEGAIKRGATAGSVVLVGTPSVNLVAQDAGASTWAIALTADTTNGGLTITVTGQAATTIRWVAKVETTEMTF